VTGRGAVDADPVLPTSLEVPPARRLLRALRVCVHALAGLATTTFVFPFADAARRRELIQRWSARLLELLRVECRVYGRLAPNGGNVLVVANHISWLDIVVLDAVCPVRFIAKAELARWPVAGRLARAGGTLFIERARRRDTHRVSGSVTEALRAGDIVAVFPEGTTSAGETTLPFKSSLLQSIVDADGDILPLAIRYRDPRGVRSTAPAYVGDDSFMTSFWRVCATSALVVDVVALERVPVAGRHRRALAKEAEDAIRRVLA
jgi:1-acyl-sn-glycerol-3-phosphate acyltransferase